MFKILSGNKVTVEKQLNDLLEDNIINVISFNTSYTKKINDEILHNVLIQIVNKEQLKNIKR